MWSINGEKEEEKQDEKLEEKELKEEVEEAKEEVEQETTASRRSWSLTAEMCQTSVAPPRHG